LNTQFKAKTAADEKRKKKEKKKKLIKILWQLKILYIYLLCISGTLGLYTHIFHSTFTIPASSNASLKKEYHPFL